MEDQDLHSIFFTRWNCNIVSDNSLTLNSFAKLNCSAVVFMFMSEFSRADVIRDFKTDDSLCYAFIGESSLLGYIVTVEKI